MRCKIEFAKARVRAKVEHTFRVILTSVRTLLRLGRNSAQLLHII
jgi:hypothetical protein